MQFDHRRKNSYCTQSESKHSCTQFPENSGERKLPCKWAQSFTWFFGI